MPLSVLFAFCFLLPLFYEISLAFSLFIELNLFDRNSSYINWYDLIDSISDVEVYGRVLYTYFVLQFLFAGLILLLVLIGVVYLTKNSKNKKIEQSIFKQLSRSKSTFLKN
jgi:NADH:ubiquinone oxidoreductase subunit 6 (subunit J)